MTITDQVLGPLLHADPASPRITHYDDAAGSRVELSGTTLANWAAKTANWFRDELDIQPGDPVAVLLPPHWQTAGVLLGAWWCGATVVTSAAGAAVALCGVAQISEVTESEELVAVGLDALGRGITGLPPRVRDFATEVRVHGDTFQPGATGPDTEKVLAAARAQAIALGLAAEDRLLCTTSWDTEIAGGILLAVLTAGASLVQCTSTALAALPHRCVAERVTVTLGAEVPPLRRAG
ncbi:MAG TPA: TIGR03089 family protein [Pseudonocardiaceae bacterium]|jgi:uncharacterized protein (TIGR03089 family)|nr:TIGR03089 family protein [Pseudonocardiaceae bacterium]